MNCPKCGGTGQIWDETDYQTTWRCVSCSHRYGKTKPKLPRVPVPKPTRPHGPRNQKQTKLRKEREKDE